MDFIRRRLGRYPILHFIAVILIGVYILLAWLHVVPSILNVHFIRKIWDKDFSKCMLHIETQAKLPQWKRHPYYITAKLSGRLGNWLFAYASLLGIAAKNKVEFFTRPDADKRVSLSRYFTVQNVKFITSVCEQHVYEKLPCAHDPKLELLPLSNFTIHGYLQSWKYFRDVEDQVRKEFTFHSNILSDAKKILLHHVTSEMMYSHQMTCVHVRRTDMMIKSSTKLGFKAAPLQYIQNAMDHFREKFNNKVRFIIISDDFSWCSKNLKFADSVVIPRNTEGVDLALMSLCNSSIISTGTFGWWGAWLANGYTVYYRNYPEPGSRLDRDTVKEDYYPPQWVPLDSAKNISPCLCLVIILLILSMGTKYF